MAVANLNKSSNGSGPDALPPNTFKGAPAGRTLVKSHFGTCPVYNKPINLVHIKKTLHILFKHDKSSSASDLIEYIRSETKHKSFYALELGNFFTLKLDFNSAIDEYLLYLSEKPKNIQFINQRIMLQWPYTICLERFKKCDERSSVCL